MKWLNKNWIINPWQPKAVCNVVHKAKWPKVVTLSSLNGETSRFIGWGRPVIQNNNPFKCPYAFIAKLQKKGFKQLGAGCFSTVLYKSGDKVIKVNRSPDAWLDYVLWASRKGYAGGLAPKVYSYKKIGTFYVAVMEKIDYCAYKIDKTDDRYTSLQLFEIAARNNNNLANKLLDQVLPGAKGFSNGLRDEFKGHKLDLHNENIMFRSDGSMVVVDPVSHESKIKGVVRLRARDFGLAPAY